MGGRQTRKLVLNYIRLSPLNQLGPGRTCPSWEDSVSWARALRIPELRKQITPSQPKWRAGLRPEFPVFFCEELGPSLREAFWHPCSTLHLVTVTGRRTLESIEEDPSAGEEQVDGWAGRMVAGAANESCGPGPRPRLRPKCSCEMQTTWSEQLSRQQS